jgi:anaerobic ribonucleoside-triphosphate reductase activating protein
MRIHHYLFSTTVNGPGKRFVLWVQGCSRKCAGCFNPETHNIEGGTEISVNDIMNLIPHDIHGITISGGEPFEQIDELLKLLKLTAQKELHTIIYTGFLYEELKSMNSESIDHCLKLTNMLIDGNFDQHIPQNHPLSGSGNQRIYILEDGNVIKELQVPEKENFCSGELTINNEGNIIATGFWDSSILEKEET